MLTSRFMPLVPTWNQMRRELDRALDAFQGFSDGFEPAAGFPPLNLWEENEALHIEAELPGMRMEDLEILVVNNELTIKGCREAETETEGKVYRRRERISGEFLRVLTLPSEVDPDKVQATLKNGVLSITLPKAEAARARRIPVKTAE